MVTTREIIVQNVVLVTDQITPSMFGQYWFIHNKIYTPEEIGQGSIFVPGFTSVNAPDSQITIVPNQIQMSIGPTEQSASYNCLKSRITKMVTALPMLPVKAIGVNFVWKVSDSVRDIHQLCNDCFGDNGTQLYAQFAKPDARLGAYFSQNLVMNTRLKLDIKPVTAMKEDGKRAELLVYLKELKKQKTS